MLAVVMVCEAIIAFVITLLGKLTVPLDTVNPLFTVSAPACESDMRVVPPLSFHSKVPLELVSENTLLDKNLKL